jgi:glucuronate isomerase
MSEHPAARKSSGCAAADARLSSEPMPSRFSADGAEPLHLHPDRFFDPEPGVRRAARELYEGVRSLPLVCPHGHVDPRLLADDEPFPEPAALIIIPDHYVFRMLYSRGVPMERLGVPTVDGASVETDPTRIWRTFAAHWHLFRGTPTGAWLDQELHDVFGVRVRLSASTASYVYDQVAERLRSPEFRPRALFDRFNIEILTTTDAAADTLEHHAAIRGSGWGGRVVPCFRPDAVFRIAASGWSEAIGALSAASSVSVHDYASFVSALEERRAFFRAHGATSTDHAVLEPYTARLPDEEAERLFQLARAGRGHGGGPAPLRGAHADGDGADVGGGRDGHAAPRRRAARPQPPGRVPPLRARQGRRHPVPPSTRATCARC